MSGGIILKNQAGKRDLRDLAVVATEDLSEEDLSEEVARADKYPQLGRYIFPH